MKRPLIVKEIIQDKTADLTPSERRLADVLLRDYPVAGLHSITKFAEAAEVSTPTVIRLARKLGYAGYPELQEALRDEASAQIKQPILKREGWPADRKDSLAFRGFAEAVFDNLSHTIDRLDPKTFDAVAKCLADPKRPIFLSGGRITRSNADYFFNHLQIIRPSASRQTSGPSTFWTWARGLS